MNAKGHHKNVDSLEDKKPRGSVTSEFKMRRDWCAYILCERNGCQDKGVRQNKSD
jgi:hypothetical protein